MTERLGMRIARLYEQSSYERPTPAQFVDEVVSILRVCGFIEFEDLLLDDSAAADRLSIDIQDATQAAVFDAHFYSPEFRVQCPEAD